MESSCTKQSECLKYRLHVEEIDKITSLLLGLSGRLARTENSIASLEANTQHITKDSCDLQEKVILIENTLLKGNSVSNHIYCTSKWRFVFQKIK